MPLIFLCFSGLSVSAQYFDSFCDFRDTLPVRSLGLSDDRNYDWNKRHNYYRIQHNADNFDGSTPLWELKSQNLKVFGDYDGFRALDFVVYREDGSVVSWMVELSSTDTVALQQIDPEHQPELILLSYTATHGFGSEFWWEDHGEIWDINAMRRIARYSTSYETSGRDHSIDGKIQIYYGQEYRRNVDYSNGILSFGESKQYTASTTIEQTDDQERTTSTKDSLACAAVDYKLENGYFILIK